MLEVDATPLVGIINNPDLPDVAMARWVAFIRTFAPTIRTIEGKKNVVPDALSRLLNHNDEANSEDDLEEFIKRSLNGIRLEEGELTLQRAYLIEAEYDEDFLLISQYLESLEQPDGISDASYRSLQ